MSSPGITDRQLEMVRHLANGMSLDEISKEMHLSLSSVKQSLASARRATGARTLPHLVSIVIAQGVLYWVDDERSLEEPYVKKDGNLTAANDPAAAERRRPIV